MKKLLVTLWFIAVASISIAFADPTPVQRLNNNHIQPNIQTDYIKAPYFVASSTTATSTFNGNIVMTQGLHGVNLNATVDHVIHLGGPTYAIYFVECYIPDPIPDGAGGFTARFTSGVLNGQTVLMGGPTPSNVGGACAVFLTSASAEASPGDTFIISGTGVDSYRGTIFTYGLCFINDSCKSAWTELWTDDGSGNVYRGSGSVFINNTADDGSGAYLQVNGNISVSNKLSSLSGSDLNLNSGDNAAVLMGAGVDTITGATGGGITLLGGNNSNGAITISGGEAAGGVPPIGNIFLNPDGGSVIVSNPSSVGSQVLQVTGDSYLSGNIQIGDTANAPTVTMYDGGANVVNYFTTDGSPSYVQNAQGGPFYVGGSSDDGSSYQFQVANGASFAGTQATIDGSGGGHFNNLDINANTASINSSGDLTLPLTDGCLEISGGLVGSTGLSCSGTNYWSLNGGGQISNNNGSNVLINTSTDDTTGTPLQVHGGIRATGTGTSAAASSIGIEQGGGYSRIYCDGFTCGMSFLNPGGGNYALAVGPLAGQKNLGLYNVNLSAFGLVESFADNFIGIHMGTGVPAYPLDVTGDAHFTTVVDAAYLQATSTSIASKIKFKLGVGTTTPFATLSVSTTGQQAGTLPLFQIASTTKAALVTVLGNGNVGIGTSSPTNIFSVQGSSSGSATKGTCFRAKDVGANTFTYWWYTAGVQTLQTTDCGGAGTTTITFD